MKNRFSQKEIDSPGFTPTLIIPLFQRVFGTILQKISQRFQAGFLYNTFQLKQKTPRYDWCRGFTVIEMVTVIAIFTILLGITMSNFDLFKKTTDFNLSAQEVAFFIKSQQQNAMAGRFPEIDPYIKNYPPVSWRPSYGLYFNKNTPDKVLQFYDANNDYLMTAGSGNTSCASDADYECMKEISFDKMAITSICAISGGACTPLDSVSITFKRPFPDARINANYTSFDFYDCEVNNNCTASTSNPTPISDTIELRFESPDVTGANVVSINPLGVLTVRRAQ